MAASNSLSLEPVQLGPWLASVAPAQDVWMVGRDGRIDGPSLEPALAEAVEALAKRAASSGEPQSSEFKSSPAEGGRYARLLARPSSNGEVAVAAMWLDSLSAMHTSLSRYALVFQATRDAVWEQNVTTQETWWNPRQYEMLGYEPGSTRASYEAWASRIHPEDRARVETHFEAAVAAGATSWQDEFRFVRGDGTVGTALDRCYIERDEQGQPLRMIGVMSDITEQRAATIALEASEERFRQLATAIDEVFWLVNAEGNELHYISPAYESIWGRTCQSLYDDPQSFTAAIHEEDRTRIEARMPEQRAGGYDVVYRIWRANGELAWIRDRAFPIHDDAGKVVRIAGIATDITAQRNLEEQLLQSQKLESIGRLAGGVAHDFNNLLTVILSSTEFALAAAERGTLRSDLEQIKGAAERAARLTDQLLAFARRQVVVPRLLDLNELAQRMHGLLRRVIGEHVELSTVLDAGLRQVLADPGQLEQVLMNLAVNARDAMPQGGRLTLQTANITVDRAYATANANVEVGEYVMMAVSDTGSGIPPEVLDHVFEPFFTTKAPGRGTGLGLATCYGTIRQAGGQIIVHSEPGKGTTFKILLPQAPEGPGSDETSTTVPRTLSGSETVLVVEDDPVLRAVAVRMLRSRGYVVLEAASGRDALSLAASFPGPIHLLLTDIVMPHMSGFELARRLLQERRDTCVLYTSGYSDEAIVHQGVAEPRGEFLPKPYVATTLLTKVRAVLEADRVA